MKLAYRLRTRRPGFTLIELLVVIAIIAILAALTTAGVMKVLGERPKVEAKTEISKLDTALNTFKQKYNRYPPSRIKLCNTLSQYVTTNALDVESLAYLNSMWPRLDWSNPIDWSGGTMSAAQYAVTLQGDQCLVFFLRGIDNGALGFSTNPKNPAATGGNRVGPFFDFKSSRLYQRSPGSHTFYSYADPFHFEDPDLLKPYLYFSSGTRENGYNDNDCSDLGVSPYYTAAGPPRRYVNPKTFQIICAGPDGMFGPGGQWTSGSGATNAGLYGTDDYSNFSAAPLGSPE